MSAQIDVSELLGLLSGEAEFALLDVRDRGVLARDGHIIHAVPLPVSLIEVLAPALLPRLGVRVVLVDEGSGQLARTAAERLQNLGFERVEILTGGVAAWQAAGQQVYTGANSYSKAFGEYVEHAYQTPHISVEDLRSKLANGEDVLLLDGRTLGEFEDFSIEGATPVPNGELPYRVHGLLRSPDTPIVVNCAGRTRSIIGAQALINSGIPNPVAALEDGTMAWLMAGHPLQHGKPAVLPQPDDQARARAQQSTEFITKTHDIEWINASQLAQFLGEQNERSLFLLDVRTRAEFEQGHLPGAIHAEGGEVVQGVDRYVGIRNARIVLIDNAIGTRAAITASWLQQLGWGQVYAHAWNGEGAVEGGSAQAQRGTWQPSVPDVDAITPKQLESWLSADAAAVIDLDVSTAHEKGHVPQARFVNRARLSLDEAKALTADKEVLVVTSADGQLARFAVAQWQRAWGNQVTFKVLEGGTQAWAKAGLALETGAQQPVHALDDVWRTPYQQADRFAAFKTYLSWERQLLDQLAQDKTVRFHVPEQAEVTP